MPDGHARGRQAGPTVLEIAEANGQTIEAGCRMGVCGADPIAIKDGMDNLSPISDDERSTLERLGHADNTRMACCCRVKGPVAVALDARQGGRADAEPDPAPSLRPLDRARRRARQRHRGRDRRRPRAPPPPRVRRSTSSPTSRTTLYNRMGINRLIYGRSAMAGLYLNPDAWYEERGITTWLNTRALRIDRDAREVELGTGERLAYDRLILAIGSSSFVPPIEGFGVPRHVRRCARPTTRWRSARLRAARAAPRGASIAGGGLLGLEAALRAAQARPARRRARALRPAAAPPARRARGRVPAPLPRGARDELVTEAEAASRRRQRAPARRAAQRRPRAARRHPARRRRHHAERRARREARARRSTAACSSTTRMRTERPGDLRGGRRRRVSRPACPGCGRPRSSRPRSRPSNALGGEKAYEGIVPVTILKVVGIELTSIGRFEPDRAATTR